MIYKFFWIVIAVFGLSACQTPSNLNDSTSTNLIELEEEIDEVDTEQLGFIDTVPALEPTEEDLDTVAVAEKPSVPTDIWDRIRAGYQLDIDVDRPRLSSQLRWYSTHPTDRKSVV